MQRGAAGTAHRRGRSRAALSTLLVLGTTAVACVDLFHTTDFETLCSRSPGDPACANDAASAGDDVQAPDAADASRPHPDFCAWSTETARSQALRACAWLGACEGPLGESAFGACVVRAQLAFDCKANPSLRPLGAVDAFWACLATVKACDEVDACVFPDGVQPCKAVDTGTAAACGSLRGNSRVRVECRGPAGRAAGVEPCVMLGQTCTQDGETAVCSGTGGFGCTTYSCASTSAVDCSLAGGRTLDRGRDCSEYGGGRCETSDAGTPICAPGKSAPACADDAEPHCDGNVVTTCRSGKEIRVDCNLLGLTCDVSRGVAASDPTEACIDRSAAACAVDDTCRGSVLESCGRGAAFKVNCESVGLGPCKLDPNGRASCTRR